MARRAPRHVSLTSRDQRAGPSSQARRSMYQPREPVLIFDQIAAEGFKGKRMRSEESKKGLDEVTAVSKIMEGNSSSIYQDCLNLVEMVDTSPVFRHAILALRGQQAQHILDGLQKVSNAVLRECYIDLTSNPVS